MPGGGEVVLCQPSCLRALCRLTGARTHVIATPSCPRPRAITLFFTLPPPRQVHEHDYHAELPKSTWLGMMRARFWSTFSHCTPEELEQVGRDWGLSG